MSGWFVSKLGPEKNTWTFLSANCSSKDKSQSFWIWSTAICSAVFKLGVFCRQCDADQCTAAVLQKGRVLCQKTWTPPNTQPNVDWGGRNVTLCSAMLRQTEGKGFHRGNLDFFGMACYLSDPNQLQKKNATSMKAQIVSPGVVNWPWHRWEFHGCCRPETHSELLTRRSFTSVEVSESRLQKPS